MRKRDTSRWGVGKLYPSPAFWSRNEATDGLHTIQIGNQLLDILIRDRRSSTTVVTFQHRVSVRTPFPTLVGEKFTGEAGVNLIAVADPSVGLDPEVPLGWYLGNRAIGHLKPILHPILSEAIDAFHPKRLIFFGSSGGGYAAMNYAADFPNSIALTVNPRLDLSQGQDRDWATYMTKCHGAVGRTPYQRISSEYGVNLADAIPSSAQFYAAMYHNTGDSEFLEKNHAPFVKSRTGDLYIAERLDFDGNGHVPIPRDKLIETVRELATPSVPQSEAMKAAGFIRPI